MFNWVNLLFGFGFLALQTVNGGSLNPTVRLVQVHWCSETGASSKDFKNERLRRHAEMYFMCR